MPRKRPTQKSRHAAAVRAVTPELYQQMLDAQKGGCAICGTPPKNRRLDIDTDHKNGFRVRGLLCHRHNRGLSFFGDDPALLRAAAAYLER